MGEARFYPARPAARDRFVLGRRDVRPLHDPWRYQGLIVENERTADGGHARIATILLTGRECPWRCAMCDLWRYTIVEDTPAGAIPAQIAAARAVLRDDPVPVSGLKLYNAGSFFDPRAVPEGDYDAIAAGLWGLSRVIVESHPGLVGPRVDRLLDALASHASPKVRLEVAMGLETAHPDALDKLNKRFTVEQFVAAADELETRGVDLRVFLLVSPPFIATDQQDEWLLRSVDVALSCGAAVVSLVPTRPGNGAMEEFAASGLFCAPDLDDIERSFALALTHAAGRSRVFVDLWDIERFARCRDCVAPRRSRLDAMNRDQRVLAPCPCAACNPLVRQ